MQVLPPSFGWHAVVICGSGIAVLIIVLTALAPESVTWKCHHPRSIRHIYSTLLDHLGLFSYLLLVMTIMSCPSHGTQDLYPDFLRSVRGVFGRYVLRYSLRVASQNPSSRT
jgi:MFS transporter, SHS family, lactate transporter